MVLAFLENIKVLDACVGFILMGLLAFTNIFVSKKFRYGIPFIILYICLIFSINYQYEITTIIIEILSLGYFVFFLFVYRQDLTKVFNSILKRRSAKSLDQGTKSQLADIIDKTVQHLSKNKIGAIMVFEKNDDLTDYINTGKLINAPVSSDILETIFYVGTPLHDGAVIIRGLNIEAASVYFLPKTSALKGKFGARHRAAMGFSEEHDAVIVVVSEETGRISFAIDGEILSVSRDDFKDRFSEYLTK